MPGGVNSPVRAFRSVGRTPFFVEKAKGAYLYDADGNRYLDYVCSWGPGILGHAVPSVVEAVQKACENGLTFGAPTEKEVELAQLIQSCVPSMEMMRLVNSGTGLYRKGKNNQVHRLLSWPFRRPAGQGRFRAADRLRAGQRRRARGLCGGDASGGIQ